MWFLASATMKPQLGVGGWIPNPRKDKADSIKNREGKGDGRLDDDGIDHVGNRVMNNAPHKTRPHDGNRGHELTLVDAQGLGPGESSEGRYVHHCDGDHGSDHAASERHRNGNSQHHHGKGEHGVHQSHGDPLPPPPESPGQAAEDYP